MRNDPRLFTILLAAALTGAACSGEAETADTAEVAEAAAPAQTAPECRVTASAEEVAARPSPLGQVEFAPGGHPARLCYGAPSANGRVVMGGELVPYGSLWRAGANEPTTFHLTGPANIGGIALEPGAYSMYFEAGPEEWTVFLNTNHERWGIPISPEVRASEVGSFTVTPEPMDEMVETLRYHWEPAGDGSMGNIVLEWENTRVAIHVM